MNAGEHFCHLAQPAFSIARHQEHVARHTRHENGGAAEGRVGDRADQARRGDVAAFELREDRGLPWYRASDPLCPLRVRQPPAQHVVLAAAVSFNRQPMDDGRETAGEAMTVHDSDTAPESLFDPGE